MEPMKIAFLGAGACGLIGAAHCSHLGHDVTLYELPDFWDLASKVKAQGGVFVDASPGNGLPNGFVPLACVTDDPQEALSGADMVFLTVPSFAEARFSEICAGILEPHQSIYMTSGYMYGSLEFCQTLREAGHSAPLHVAEMNSTIYAGGRLDPVSVRAGGYKHGIEIASFPGRETTKMVDQVRRLYPEVLPVSGILETGVSNPNAALHPLVVLFNASYVGCGEDVLLYHKGKYRAAMSEPVADVYERMDAERLSLSGHRGFGELRPWREIFRVWYDYFGAKGETLIEIMSSNPALLRAKLPESFGHRYIREDVTAGLLPLIEQLDRHGIDCPTMKAIVHLSSILSHTDLNAMGRTLKSLGLAHLTNDELCQYLYDGEVRR